MKIIEIMINKFCKSRSGLYSSKRITGLSLAMIGAIEKIILFFYTLIFKLDNFNQLDSSANWLITFGIGCLTTTLFEKKDSDQPTPPTI